VEDKGESGPRKREKENGLAKLIVARPSGGGTVISGEGFRRPMPCKGLKRKGTIPCHDKFL